MDKMRVGIIGCGNIAPAYFKGCGMFRLLEAAACADLNAEAAKARAKEFNVTAMTVDELLASPDIDLVVNLTIPKVHAAVSRAALAAGKHVHSEKPLGITLEEGAALVQAAATAQRRLGCAPDTFLGAGLQTCRKVIDDGWIGRPLAGTAFMMGRGPEGWHPNPAFFYERGGGPMLDMGPYYITALVHLLGPVKGQEILRNHLAFRPGDRPVMAQLITLSLEDAAGPEPAPLRALRATLEGIKLAPDQAGNTPGP